MNLAALLDLQGIDPQTTIILRHRPAEPALRRVLPVLFAERRSLFEAYQQTQGPTLEKAMLGANALISFIGHEPGKALFVGAYRIGDAQLETPEQFAASPSSIELQAYGMMLWPDENRPRNIRRFDLAPVPFYDHWQGRLVVGWPPPERSWWRRAHRNDFPVDAIHHESILLPEMPRWSDLVLDWQSLQTLPERWRNVLKQWRAIYHIRDRSDGKAYVGAAYGDENLHTRWMRYRETGHGDNRWLREREADDLSFSILELLSPAATVEEVIGRETSWKRRLQTRHPAGLNGN